MPLGKRTDFGDARYTGLEVPFSSDVEKALEDAMACGFDFIAAPLAEPSRCPPAPSPRPDGSLVPPFLPHQVMHTMASSQLSNQLVGRVSAWINPDADDPAVQRSSAAALRQEIGWAAHMTVQACLLPPPPRGLLSSNYAQAINQAIVSGAASMALWLQVPVAGQTPPGEDDHTGGPPDRSVDPWEWWNAVRFACCHSTRLNVALQVGPDLPQPADLARWWGEPLKAVILQTDAFMTNRRGYPALSKRHQDFVSEAMRRGVQVILAGEAHHLPPAPSPAAPPPPPPPPSPPGSNPSAPTPAEAAQAEAGPANDHPMRVYWEYLSFLFRKREPTPNQEMLEAAYRDYLQAPLQPLQDNLESATYETFERDATKYEVYGEALRRALLDTVLDTQAAEHVSVVMVVGAGRGPLVAAALTAAAAAGRLVKVYAVEKNPNAVVHLHARAAAEDWGQRVTIIHADMREWKAPEQADVLVSELLGSFGDNELSPECLDGAQRFLRPGGVSIPQAYTSFLHPVTAHKLWTDVNAFADLEHFETPFVVKLFRCAPLAPPQAVFTFSHPNQEEVIDNSRAARLVFKCIPPSGTVCHGLAGYFDAQLYKDVHLSILPETHTPNMFSWFPIFFPLRQPFYVAPGAEMEVSMWRCATRHKVWYEWTVNSPQASPIHNPEGRSYFVGL